MGEERSEKTFRVVKTTEDIAAVLREFPVISSTSVLSPWRLPSRIWLEQQIAQETALIDDLFWLVEPARVESETQSAKERIAALSKELDRYPPLPATPMRLRRGHIRDGIEFSPGDQVVSVKGQISIPVLQKALAEHGQCLPLPSRGQTRFLRVVDSIAGAIDFNLPHALEAQCGSWRDWILGMTVVLADGAIAKAGSHAVKNVAGYDVHKLMVGARGTLGIITEVILRTYPIAALPKPEVTLHYDWKGWRESRDLTRLPLWLQRTSHCEFAQAVRNAGERLLEADWASATLCARVPQEEELPRFAGDWVLRARCGKKNLEFTDQTEIRLMKRAKEIFDPGHKLNPGEMGIF